MNKAGDWFKKAKKEKFAIGAFNAGSIETLKAIVGAAGKLRSPVMVEASPGEAEYFGMRELVGVVRALEQSNGIPIILNLDHARDYEVCRQAIAFGFDYIHFDGSKLNLTENTETTKRIVGEAHEKGILVEGEIDQILGSSADHRADADGYRKQMSDTGGYTKPEEAKKFVHESGVDTFAAFVGNVHGLYPGPKRINLGLLEDIKREIPETFLSLHGGSGIPESDVRAALERGVVKVNVNSELRVAFRDTLKEILMGPEGEEVAIYKMMPGAISAMQEIIEGKIKLFGSNGKV